MDNRCFEKLHSWLVISFVLLLAYAFGCDRARSQPQAASTLSLQKQIVVREITLKGNTVLDEATLAQLIRPYINRTLTLGELQELRESITRTYIEQGYISSGAVIPDQEISNGNVTIQIVEGRLSQVNVEGHERLKTSYFTERLLADFKVLNLGDLQEKIRALHDDPLIQKIDVELRPGTRLGDSILDVTVTEAKPYTVGFGINNHRSPSVGEYRFEVVGIHQNITKHADRLAAQFGYTEGLKDATLEYAIPLNRNKTTLTVGTGFSESEVIEDPFDAIGIRSETERYFITVSHPFYTRRDGYLNASISVEQRKSESFLFNDRPWELSPGATNGVAKVSVIRAEQEWLTKSENSVFALRSRFSFGLDAGGSTINPRDEEGREVPDSEFTSWLGQLQWLRRLTWRDSLLVVESSIHHAFDPLLSIEKSGLGGADTVRGYRENTLVRDKTRFASIEHRLPLFGPRWQLVSFYDWGEGENVNDTSGASNEISSIGLGLRWHGASGNYAGEVYWADPLDEVVTLDDSDSLQDDGIHFSLDARF